MLDSLKDISADLSKLTPTTEVQGVADKVNALISSLENPETPAQPVVETPVVVEAPVVPATPVVPTEEVSANANPV